MTRPALLLAGAAHLDRYGRCDAMPVAGRSNPGRFMTLPGGAAFNVASSLAALGVGVRLHSILGEDPEAGIVREAAAARGVDLRAQVSADHATATYTSIVGPDGALTIALADMAIYDAFDPTQAVGADGWRLIDANLPPAAIEALLAHGEGHRVAMTVSAAKAARLRPALPRIDVLFTNRAELAALCGTAPDAPMDEMLRDFREMGGNDALVTDGSDDIWTLEDGESRHHPVPAMPRVVDVTGAGDALTAGCLAALMAGRSLADAVPRGIRAAQAVLAIHGPWRADLATTVAQPSKEHRT